MNAARKAKEINELIAKVARLGRNTGVHLLLASQELGQELDKSVLGNIGTRLCLGCMPKTSEQILGNDEAKTNFKQKGRLIINNNPAKENNVDENISLRTPFLDDKPDKKGEKWCLFNYMEELGKLGKAIKKEPFYNLSFYDEEAMCYENKFKDYIKGKSQPNLLYLGEPSFVLKNDDGEKWLRINLKEEIAQNILIYSPMKLNKERYLKMLLHNFKDMQDRKLPILVTHIYSNKESFNNVNVGLQSRNLFMRDFDASMQAAINSALYRRVMIECDEQAFDNAKIVPADIKMFEEAAAQLAPDKYKGELWNKRVQILLNFFRGPYSARMGFDAISNIDQKKSAVVSQIFAVLQMYEALGMQVTKLTVESLKNQYIIVQGLELISQLGVDSRSPRVEMFKKIINESPEYRVFFVLTTSTLEDCSVLRSSITHTMCDNLTTQMQGHLKIADFYPDNCSPALGIYYLSTAEKDRCRKFKKMIFNGEIMA